MLVDKKIRTGLDKQMTHEDNQVSICFIISPRFFGLPTFTVGWTFLGFKLVTNSFNSE